MKRCRESLDETEVDKISLAVPEPWPEAITDAPALFDAIHDRLVTYAYLPPGVYRVVGNRKPPPTVVFDEIDTHLPLYRELVGLLNAGNSSDACVPRCVGKTIRVYRVLAPVVLAGNGDLFRTLRSRSILIHMTQAPEGVTLTRFDPNQIDLEKILAQKLARWAVDNLKPIAACEPPRSPVCTGDRLVLLVLVLVVVLDLLPAFGSMFGVRS